MTTFDWNRILELAAQKATLFTITKKPFQIVAASGDLLIVQVSTHKEYTISRSNLESAVEIIKTGVILQGPMDYRNLVADERPAYAWAILKHLGYLN